MDQCVTSCTPYNPNAYFSTSFIVLLTPPTLGYNIAVVTLVSLVCEVKGRVEIVYSNRITIELEAVIKKAWAQISVQRCANLIDSMPRRCDAVIKNFGYPTKY
uniref:Tyrosine-protein phosphatase domain-containing protein n=1 Tax=Heterorhabditis bacteriophora TaxID=37862 RepID=A0A1I7WWA7_HETBA